MTQLGLTLQPPSVRDSRTSAQAADGIRGAANALRQRVLDLLRTTIARGTDGLLGLTDEEMQGLLDMNPSTQRPRRSELVALGLVMDSGRTRPTRSGRQATVWVSR